MSWFGGAAALEGRGLPRWSWLASALCAIHCLAAPALALAGAGIGLSGTMETAVLGLGVAVGGAALRAGLRRHGRWGPAVLAMAGLIGEVAGPGIGGMGEMGAILMFGAMMWNLRLRAPGCGCGVCERAR